MKAGYGGVMIEVTVILLVAGTLAGVTFVVVEPCKLPENPAVHSPEHLSLPPVEISRRSIPLQEFQAFVRNQSGLVLDARSKQEYEKGHIPGAISLSAEDFERRYASLSRSTLSDKNQPLVVYCSGHACRSAAEVRKALLIRNHPHVRIFTRGWTGWRSAQLLQGMSEK